MKATAQYGYVQGAETMKKYIPQVKIFENRKDWRWSDIRPFGGTIVFGLESDVQAFLADWGSRFDIKPTEMRYIIINQTQGGTEHESTHRQPSILRRLHNGCC